MSNYTVAFQFMWRQYKGYTLSDIVDGCLVIMWEDAGMYIFHCPLPLSGKDEDILRCVSDLENYCRENYRKIAFVNVPEERLHLFTQRYMQSVEISYTRRWQDYLYNAQDFISYKGNRFSGQRNHVNRFKCLYPQAEFKEFYAKDVKLLNVFLKEYEAHQKEKGDPIALGELKSVKELLPFIDEMGLYCAGFVLGGKIIGFSVGERLGDTLFIHVEKALAKYEGIYPALASAFAQLYAGDAKYINREDDSGDKGLRKSKLQYNPLELVKKPLIIPKTLLDGVKREPVLTGERISLHKIKPCDMGDLYALEADKERNKYWGYCWWEKIPEDMATPEYFLKCVNHDFKCRIEMPLGIFLCGSMIGEVVLHNFSYCQSCEVGVRLLKQFEGQGYAKEALLLLMDYAFYSLGCNEVTAKCNKENVKSRAALLSAGMRQTGEEELYFFFVKTPKM